MSLLLLWVGFVAAVNPLRGQGGLGGGSRPEAPAAAVGGALSLVVVAALAGGSAPLLEALEVSPETFAIAAGMVAIVAGGFALAVPVPTAEPPLQGWRAGMWPVAYPRMLSPEVLMLAVTAGAQNGTVSAVAAAAGGIVPLALLAAWPRSEATTRRLAAFGRVLAALLVLTGVFLTIEGIRDV